MVISVTLVTVNLSPNVTPPSGNRLTFPALLQHLKVRADDPAARVRGGIAILEQTDIGPCGERQTAPKKTSPKRHIGWTQVGTAIVFGLFGISAVSWFFGDLHPSNLAGALSALSLPEIAFSAALSLLALALLGGLDVIASLNLRPRRLPLGTAWWSGFQGFSISNFAGFALLTGGMVRFPIYRRYDVGTASTVGMMSLSWSAFWIASSIAISSVVLFDPNWSAAMRTVAAAALVLVGVVFFWLGRAGRSLSVKGRKIILPPARLALAQTMIALTELLVSALSLYVLLGDVAPPLTGFVAAYVIAVGIGLLSHVPAGFGTFEASLLALSGMSATASFAAAIVAYRANRFLLPLLITGPFLLFRILRNGKAARISDL